MCTPNNDIKFCTCEPTEEIHVNFADEVERIYEMRKFEAEMAKENGTYNDTHFKWELNRFHKPLLSRMGQMSTARKIFNDKLTEEAILSFLNSGTSFDFEYVPDEKDLIEIREHFKYLQINKDSGIKRPKINSRAMSFTFLSGEWHIGDYSGGYSYRNLKKGTVT
ncbi:hypothetical protein [Kordia sp.]|uniref:hypothetical protein n=1 Tax=Kordia sp. TaxID=1965332 RepID=UPI003D6A1616